jgi:hypothetical protein
MRDRIVLVRILRKTDGESHLCRRERGRGAPVVRPSGRLDAVGVATEVLPLCDASAGQSLARRIAARTPVRGSAPRL